MLLSCFFFALVYSTPKLLFNEDVVFNTLKKFPNKSKHYSSDGRVVRASVLGAVDSGLIPCGVKPMT